MHAVDVAKPGKSIIIRNAKIDMFRGSMRLAVNQWGKLEESSEALDVSPQVISKPLPIGQIRGYRMHSCPLHTRHARS